MKAEYVHDVQGVTDGTLYDIPQQGERLHDEYHELKGLMQQVLHSKQDTYDENGLPIPYRTRELESLRYTLEDVVMKRFQTIAPKNFEVRRLELRLKIEMSPITGKRQYNVQTVTYYGPRRNDNIKWTFDLEY
jgi:hypothetical protein